MVSPLKPSFLMRSTDCTTLVSNSSCVFRCSGVIGRKNSLTGTPIIDKDSNGCACTSPLKVELNSWYKSVMVLAISAGVFIPIEARNMSLV